VVETFAETVAKRRQCHATVQVACKSPIDDYSVIAMVYRLGDTPGGRILTGDIHLAGMIELNPTVLCGQSSVAQSARLARGAD